MNLEPDYQGNFVEESFRLFDIMAMLLALSAFFGWINHTFIRLPHTIGLLVMALAASLVLIAADTFFDGFALAETLRASIGQIDFYSTVMEGMLAFLLFAGALHVDFDFLKDQRWAIGIMATFGVIISTVIVGFGFWYLAGLFGVNIPLIWALLFGALISPTDPVAVLSLLKSINIPHSLEAKIAGESLFNDGVGVVVFIILMAVAGAGGGHGGEHAMGALDVAKLFVMEAGGGALLGAVTGWIAYRAMATMDEYSLEILISLGVVAGTYALALHLHVSGPIAVVIAGLLIGNRGARIGMSEKTQKHLFAFWELIDEILNSVLFLLIGLEVLVITFAPEMGWLALCAIILVLLARLIAVSLPIGILSHWLDFTPGAIPVLTWGGLRGGISVALALSLPDNEYKPMILTATYAVVLFSIIVQGLTVKQLINKTVDPTLL